MSWTRRWGQSAARPGWTFELIGMDACLMGHLEVLTMLASHARYAVVSQETEPALGWAYAAFLASWRPTRISAAPSWGADRGELYSG